MGSLIQSKKKVMMMQENTIVPAGYTKVDWIRMPSDAYIDTDFVPTISPKIETSIRSNTAGDYDIFGFRNVVFPLFTVDVAANVYWYNRWGGTSYNYFIAHLNKNGPTDCIFWKITKVGEYEFIYPDVDFNTDWTTNTQTMLVGAGRNTECDITIYSFKFYDGDAIVRELVPCYRNTDNKPGMYDTVSKTFYTNAGTGDFIIPD